ncbi:MAG: FG-GAP repeat domain-containing protein, partial [Thermoanaerobaculia bacterium]
LFLANADGRHALYLQGSDVRFEHLTAKLGPGAEPGLATACASGDFDNDGLPDLLVAGYGGARLHQNTPSGF